MTREWESVATCDDEKFFKQWKEIDSKWWASWRYDQTEKHDGGTTLKYLCDHYKKYNQAYDCKMKMRVRQPEDSEKVEVEIKRRRAFEKTSVGQRGLLARCEGVSQKILNSLSSAIVAIEGNEFNSRR
uniref:Uncharacterized protein n=1 Tax=Ditylenchus dipsaci TaxID=166011 RepID=A0A915DW81_9BILA